MRKRRPNYRLVKTHRSYKVEEAAVLGTHKNTVRAGEADFDSDVTPNADLAGPSPLPSGPPDKEQAALPAWEIYCVRCRAPKRPMGTWPITPDHETFANWRHLPGLRRDDLPARLQDEVS